MEDALKKTRQAAVAEGAQISLPGMEKRRLNLAVFGCAGTDHGWFGSVALLRGFSSTGFISDVPLLAFRV